MALLLQSSGSAAEKAKKLLLDSSYFVPREAFEGHKPGYVFTTRKKYGTGYFKDGAEEPADNNAETEVAAYSFLSTSVSLISFKISFKNSFIQKLIHSKPHSFKTSLNLSGGGRECQGDGQGHIFEGFSVRILCG